MTPLEIIAIIYPDFSTTANVNSFISLAEGMTSQSFFGASYSLAVALRACHMYVTLVARKGQPGYLTHESAGTLSRSYGGVVTYNTSNLTSSSYGMQLLDLINSGSLRGLSTSEYIQTVFLSE
jgi:hypothetical protein